MLINNVKFKVIAFEADLTLNSDITLFIKTNHVKCGPGSSGGIATNYGLDGPGTKSR